MAQTGVVRLRRGGVAAERKSALINLLIDLRQKENGNSRSRRKKSFGSFVDQASLS